MAAVSFTNLSSETQYVTDFSSIVFTVPIGETVTYPRDLTPADLAGASRLQASVAAGDISVVVVPSSDELESGLLVAPTSITGDDVQAVPAAEPMAAIASFFHIEAAGVGGAPDDVEIYAADAIPFKCRILDVVIVVTDALATHTLEVRDEAAGAGTLLATLDAATAGRKVDATANANMTVITPGVTKGIFVRRSDSGLGFQAFITYRREE